MSLYKRGTTWWMDFTTPAGERVRLSAKTSNKVEAQELHDRLKAEHWRSRSWESDRSTLGTRQCTSGS